MSDIRPIASTDNVVVDTMSQPVPPSQVNAVLATQQTLDYATITVAKLEYSQGLLPLPLAGPYIGTMHIVCNTSMAQLRPLIPLDHCHPPLLVGPKSVEVQVSQLYEAQPLVS